MFYQESLLDIPNVISSPGSESGAIRSDAPDGRMIEASGLDHALASLSAMQAKERALLTSGIYGQHSSTSSESVNLMLSLANRLRKRTDLLGSTLYRLTWNQKRMRSGRSLFRLAASERRIKGSGFTSWQTPTVQDAHGRDRHNQKNGGVILSLLGEVRLAAWPTPTATERSGQGEKNSSLYQDARLASWESPTTRDAKDGDCSEQIKTGAVEVNALLGRQALLMVSGETPNGSTAEMTSIGQLDPAHSRWLMGLPPEFCDCAVTAMALLRRARKSSSAPISK